MPRQPRQRSETGIYHVILKGIDGRNIFIEEGDRKKFLTQLFNAKGEGRFALLAYCLMDNHIHLLIEENEDIGTCMKRITVGYVRWHNFQYGRTGHLFQNRYLSEPVETDNYLMAVARYIHQNPVKAGMVEMADKYTWSSYRKYMEKYDGKQTDLDTGRIMGYFGSKQKFEKFMNEQREDKFLECRTASILTDDELMAIIQQKYEAAKPFQKLATEERKQLIRKLYENETTSIRQLARVLGISKWLVEQAL